MTGTLDLAEDGYDLSVDLVIDGDARPSTDSGAWGVDGDRFVLDSDEPESQTLVFTYALEGTTLTLTGVAGSPVEEMILERTN